MISGSSAKIYADTATSIVVTSQVQSPSCDELDLALVEEWSQAVVGDAPDSVFKVSWEENRSNVEPAASDDPTVLDQYAKNEGEGLRDEVFANSGQWLNAI